MPGHEYIFRIRAQNKYGVGDPLDSEPEVARDVLCRFSLQQSLHLEWFGNILTLVSLGDYFICRLFCSATWPMRKTHAF